MKECSLPVMVLLLTLIRVPAAPAQTGVGICAGYNGASLTVNTSSLRHFSILSGMHGGLFFSRPLQNHITGQLGIYYSQTGARYLHKIRTTGFRTVEDITARSSSLFLPLTVRYDVRSRPSQQVYLILGGYFSIRFSGALTGSISGDYEKTVDLPVNDLARKRDYGLTCGLGVRSQLQGYTVFAEIIYAGGMANMYRPGPSFRADNLTVKSTVVMVTLGVMDLFSFRL